MDSSTFSAAEHPLRICLDARLGGGGGCGGVEQFVIGMASGLSRLPDGREEYLFLVGEDATEWLRPFVDGPCRLLPSRRAAARPPRPLRTIYRIFPGRDPYGHLAPLAGKQTVRIPRSTGVVEGERVDVIHFTFQTAFLTKIPSIYHPHDLQHLHLPQFFTQREWNMRETQYRSFCQEARMVAVNSLWTRRDLLQRYGLPEDKVCVVPLAPPIGAYPVPGEEDISSVRRKFALPGEFLLFPAATWPHKNHIGLLEALARLRDTHGLTIPAVFTGSRTDFFPAIQRRVSELGLSDQARFLGFVTPVELQALYRLCRCVVVPTLFEAASFPLWEAFLAGAPAACSNVTSLPEQAGDAALVFDPGDAEEMSSSIRRLWLDASLRERLAGNGRRNVERFSWNRTARIFRAHYRRIAGILLGEEDRRLIAAPALF